jgi:hypothetical protein
VVTKEKKAKVEQPGLKLGDVPQDLKFTPEEMKFTPEELKDMSFEPE